MKHNRFARRLLAGIVTAALSLSVLPLSASAEWQHIGCLGDLDRDQRVSLTDLIVLIKHLHAQSPLTDDNLYEVNGATIGINGADGFQAGQFINTADINEDGAVDVFDLGLMKRYVLLGDGPWVWRWENETVTPTEPEVPTEPDIPTEPADPGELGDFISPPIEAVKGFLPSQGNSQLVILYVDFPDCPYRYAPSVEEIEQIAFGAENPSNPNYPFDSAAGFYQRASKGAMQLGGKAFRYTAKYNNAAYDDVAGRQALVKEALKAFEDSADFSQFDSDNDGFIDTTLLSVPKAAGDDNWWPCAGPVDDYNFFVDGKMIGHIITSNAQIESPTNYYNFNGTILHEMGHCMGLPDFYLYHGNDTEGTHGTAGSEMMEDNSSDFSCVSKLQYGWYRAGQIEVFDESKSSATYTLHNAQTDAGNVLVIPCGKLDAQYHSEYMLVEYMTADRNNSNPQWWVRVGNGIRVYHVDATIQTNYWGGSFLYGSGAPATNNDEGRRLLRVIDDRDVDNLYRTGDVIDGNISGFHWYDANGYQTIDTGITITVGALTGDGYEITVTRTK